MHSPLQRFFQPGPSGISTGQSATPCTVDIDEVAGPAAPPGPPGPAGQRGQTGQNGAAGQTGAGGPVGGAGPAGEPGPPGPAGQRGQNGENGQNGAAGQTGAGGPPGTPGSAGGAGPPGPAGQRGQNGAVGQTGAGGPAGVVNTDLVQEVESRLRANITSATAAVAAGVAAVGRAAARNASELRVALVEAGDALVQVRADLAELDAGLRAMNDTRTDRVARVEQLAVLFGTRDVAEVADLENRTTREFAELRSRLDDAGAADSRLRSTVDALVVMVRASQPTEQVTGVQDNAGGIARSEGGGSAECGCDKAGTTGLGVALAVVAVALVALGLQVRAMSHQLAFLALKTSSRGAPAVGGGGPRPRSVKLVKTRGAAQASHDRGAAWRAGHSAPGLQFGQHVHAAAPDAHDTGLDLDVGMGIWGISNLAYDPTLRPAASQIAGAGSDTYTYDTVTASSSFEAPAHVAIRSAERAYQIPFAAGDGSNSAHVSDPHTVNRMHVGAAGGGIVE